MSNDKWGDLKAMSREELLLTKADIEANIVRIRSALDRDGDQAKPNTHHALRVSKADFSRVNVYLSIDSARSKKESSLQSAFYKVAKAALSQEQFQDLLNQAKEQQ